MLKEVLLIAICAYTYSHILTGANMILERPADWVNMNLPSWLSKPLLICPLCVSGQWAFWLFLCLHFNEYDLLTHIAYTLGTIFTVYQINRINERN